MEATLSENKPSPLGLRTRSPLEHPSLCRRQDQRLQAQTSPMVTVVSLNSSPPRRVVSSKPPVCKALRHTASGWRSRTSERTLPGDVSAQPRHRIQTPVSSRVVCVEAPGWGETCFCYPQVWVTLGTRPDLWDLTGQPPLDARNVVTDSPHASFYRQDHRRGEGMDPAAPGVCTPVLASHQLVKDAETSPNDTTPGSPASPPCRTCAQGPREPWRALPDQEGWKVDSPV